MGGQACVLYGAAEFSRDVDFAVVASPENLRRIERAVAELDARVIAVPPFESGYLERGHAIHFRCSREDVKGFRIDIMARMRGVAPFERLWQRRTTLELPGDGATPLEVAVLSLPDLVAAKKTQRDRDWPMIRRLVEANYFTFRTDPTPARIAFWLRELRTPELLLECVRLYPEQARSVARDRVPVEAALDSSRSRLDIGLAGEQAHEQAADRAYWAPLRAELERLRHPRPDRQTNT